MTIRELMSGGLITVRRETPILEARDLMAKERIRHLLVTDTGGALLGIVTDRDIRLFRRRPRACRCGRSIICSPS